MADDFMSNAPVPDAPAEEVRTAASQPTTEQLWKAGKRARRAGIPALAAKYDQAALKVARRRTPAEQLRQAARKLGTLPDEDH